MTVIGVSTMHLMHPNYCQITAMCECVCTIRFPNSLSLSLSHTHTHTHTHTIHIPYTHIHISFPFVSLPPLSFSHLHSPPQYPSLSTHQQHMLYIMNTMICRPMDNWTHSTDVRNTLLHTKDQRKYITQLRMTV